MTKYIKSYSFAYQIRVNSVQPTIVMTEMGRAYWNTPEKSDPYMRRTPVGHFAGTLIMVYLTLITDIHSSS